jgi:hypothetical protein
MPKMIVLISECILINAILGAVGMNVLNCQITLNEKRWLKNSIPNTSIEKEESIWYESFFFIYNFYLFRLQQNSA